MKYFKLGLCVAILTLSIGCASTKITFTDNKVQIEQHSLMRQSVVKLNHKDQVVKSEHKAMSASFANLLSSLGGYIIGVLFY